MTTYYHDPLLAADAGSLAAINARLGDLDAAIYSASLLIGKSITAVAGEDLGDRNAAYLKLSDGKIYLMDADASGPKAGKIRGFVDGTTLTGATATLVISGLLDGFSGLTPFADVYASSSAGGVTQTRPSASLGGGQIMIAKMGFAIAADTILVRPEAIEYHLRDAMADDDVLTLLHHADDAGYQRNVWAYLLEETAGATVTSYASANRDSDVALSNKTVATYGSDLCTGGTAIGNMTDDAGLAGAFDNNAATGASKSGVAGQIGYDFGSTKTIRRYTIQEYTVPATTRAPQDWTFEYSSDNSNWFVADTRTNETGWSSGETRTFDVSANFTARYWRVNITDNNGAANTSVGEIQMMEVATYTDGATKLAQTFNLASTKTIAEIDLWLKKVGSPAGTVTVRIETLTGSDPSGTLAHASATQTFTESGLGTSYAAQLVTFASSFSLATGDYAIVISTSRATDDDDYIHWGADGSAPSYAGGSMRSYAGSWAAASKDAVFTIYEPPTVNPAQISVDWWSSTFADMVNRYGDGSGVDLDTQTTFKCVRAAGFDDVTLIVRLA